jgi:hypothetical protein
VTIPSPVCESVQQGWPPRAFVAVITQPEGSESKEQVASSPEHLGRGWSRDHRAAMDTPREEGRLLYSRTKEHRAEARLPAAVRVDLKKSLVLPFSLSIPSVKASQGHRPANPFPCSLRQSFSSAGSPSWSEGSAWRRQH